MSSIGGRNEWIQTGIHDTGFWDAENEVMVDKNAKVSGMSVDQAIKYAQSNPGAEVIVLEKDGSASVHEVKIDDSFWSEDKKILNTELNRQGKAQTGYPLLFDDNLAEKLDGGNAFLVDEKNSTTYIGNKVSSTTNERTQEALQMILRDPNKNNAAAAYQVGKELNSTQTIEKGVAKHLLGLLSTDYKNTPEAGKFAAVLDPNSNVKKIVDTTISELGNIEETRAKAVSELKTKIKERTNTYNKDIAEPEKNLNSTSNAYSSKKALEDKNVTTAENNLYFAQRPDLPAKQSALDLAKSTSDRSKREFNSARDSRVGFENTLSGLNKKEAQNMELMQKNESLNIENSNIKMQNNIIPTKVFFYINKRLDQIDREISLTQRELDRELAKPPKPTGTSSTGSGTNLTYNQALSYANSIAGGNSLISKEELTAAGYNADQVRAKLAIPAGASLSVEQFADGLVKGKIEYRGSQSGNSVNSDPFSSGNGSQYRDERKIRELKDNLDDLKTEKKPLDAFTSNLRFNSAMQGYFNYFNSGLFNNDYFDDTLALGFFHGDNAKVNDIIMKSVDSYVINSAFWSAIGNRSNDSGIDYHFLKNSKEVYNNNSTKIKTNEQSLKKNEATIRNNNQELTQKPLIMDKLGQATIKESEAKATYESHYARFVSASDAVEEAKNSPDPLDSPSVAPFNKKLIEAQKSREDSVGPNSTLLKNFQKAQSIYDTLYNSYMADRSKLESQVKTAESGSQGMATAKINEALAKIR